MPPPSDSGFPAVPATRVRACNRAPVRPDGEFVLYWMIAARRTRWNFALERAVEHAVALSRPLVVLEALRLDYEFASERLHAFVLEGMADNAAELARTIVTYHPWVETAPGAGRGLLAALAAHACVVVTDDAPVFFLPRMVEAAAALPVLLEAVDGCGLLPLAATSRVFGTAAAFRRFLQGVLPESLDDEPRPDPLAGARLPRLRTLPEEVLRRWPAAPRELLEGRPSALAALSVDHRVGRVEALRGGARAGRTTLRRFVDHDLAGYDERRNHPGRSGTSGLSPYLHFGHVGAHEAFAAVASHEAWRRGDLAARPTGKRSGWWGMGPGPEAFLDQLVTWRELGFNFASGRRDGDRFDALPPWARTTLERHAADPRAHLYARDRLEDAATHDPLWNAAQRQLRREGRIHGYLRMLWGKKILEWSPSPQQALEVMLELNNRWALDGRDPNSTSGIAWCLGRYDRPWGPERAIFGFVRYMSSENAARKLRVAEYLSRFAP